MLAPFSPTPPFVPKLSEILSLLHSICETPAPTFAEQARASCLQQLWQAAGLEVRYDAVGNLLTHSSSKHAKHAPHILLVAHMDTVFPADVPIKISPDTIDKDILRAPGIGDNSANLALLTAFLRHRAQHHYPHITVAASVGEEGLGDLHGIRHILQEQPNFDAVIAIDGHLGIIVKDAVGSKRFEIHLSAAGGHSWGDYPSPSAIHALADMIAHINRMEIPRMPRSSYNIGQVSGGTSINTIAESAFFNLDIRSEDAHILQQLEKTMLERIKRTAQQHAVEVTIQAVGNRPAAQGNNAGLVRQAKAALHAHGLQAYSIASSTDASAAMALNIPAISFGLYHGGDAHRLSEWIQASSMLQGYRVLDSLLTYFSHDIS